MEAENALTIAKENSKENFFEEEARLWAEVYYIVGTNARYD